MTFCIIITLLILNYIKIYSSNNIFRWPRSKLSWAPKEERGTKAPFVNTFGSTHPLQSSNKKIPLNCHQLVFLTWFALPMIVWQSTMESFFSFSPVKTTTTKTTKTMHFPRKFALCKSCLNFEHQRTLLSCSAMHTLHPGISYTLNLRYFILR